MESWKLSSSDDLSCRCPAYVSRAAKRESACIAEDFGVDCRTRRPRKLAPETLGAGLVEEEERGRGLSEYGVLKEKDCAGARGCVDGVVGGC